jgi:hypothetical protein
MPRTTMTKRRRTTTSTLERRCQRRDACSARRARACGLACDIAAVRVYCKEFCVQRPARTQTAASRPRKTTGTVLVAPRAHVRQHLLASLLKRSGKDSTAVTAREAVIERADGPAAKGGDGWRPRRSPTSMCT